MKDKPQDRIQRLLWNKNTFLFHIFSRLWHKCSLSIFVGLGLWGFQGTKINFNKIHTGLGTATSIPTMCLVGRAWTLGARITGSFMFTWSISGSIGGINILRIGVSYDLNLRNKNLNPFVYWMRISTNFWRDVMIIFIPKEPWLSCFPFSIGGPRYRARCLWTYIFQES